MKYKTRERVLSKDVAEGQFHQLLDAYDVDAASLQAENPEAFKGVESVYNLIIDRIERGLLTIEDDGAGGVNIIQKFTRPIDNRDSVTYKHLTSKHLIARDKCDTNELRKNATLAAMSGVKTDFFNELAYDVNGKTADMVYTFFRIDY